MRGTGAPDHTRRSLRIRVRRYNSVRIDDRASRASRIPDTQCESAVDAQFQIILSVLTDSGESLSGGIVPPAVFNLSPDALSPNSLYIVWLIRSEV
jgi:hypothetical protein